MADKTRVVGQSRVFAYIISSVGAGYKLTGFVPWVRQGKVFFGPCKKRMRPDVCPGDYIMGISGAEAGRPRRILLWMRVAKTMTFKEAYDMGRTDKIFRALRGTAIHVRPRRFATFFPGEPGCYEHIRGADHSENWPSDIRGTRDAFLVGEKSSWVIENEEAPAVTEELVELLKEGIRWKGHATLGNPLTENARGKHAVVMGHTAEEIIARVPKTKNPLYSSRLRTASACERTCSCE